MDGRGPQRADRRLHESFASAARRKVARQAVHESLVLLQNNQRTLPIGPRAKRMHIAGRVADGARHSVRRLDGEVLGRALASVSAVP